MIFTLIGMPGCGKSCMGRVVSKKLGMKNIDSDKLIEAKYGKKLFEIIDEYGTEEFKKIEEDILLNYDGDNVILSTGGSAVYYPRAMERLRSLGKIVYLYCSYDVIKERLGDFSKRGVVLREGQTLRDLYDERTVLYKKYADIIVDCSGNAYPRYQARVMAAIRGVLESE
ncbi:MAG: shikimate kinase [Ruminococcaceae bacterium]|nr:shikimate kinase [Oscillospiraceae bacterium]